MRIVPVLILVSSISCARESANDASSPPRPTNAHGGIFDYMPLVDGNVLVYEVFLTGATQKRRRAIVRVVRVGPAHGALVTEDGRDDILYAADGVLMKGDYILKAPLAVGTTWTVVAKAWTVTSEWTARIAAVGVPLRSPAGATSR